LGSGPISLTPPDGTQFGPATFFTKAFTVSSFAELSSRFFGTWTLREDGFISSQEDSIYSFSFGFALEDIFHESPVIDYPANGSSIPSVFEASWSYPSGTILPSNWAVSHSPAATVGFPKPQTVRFNVDLAELDGRPFTFRAGSFDNLTEFISPVSLVSGPQRTNYGTRARFLNFSLPITVTVVPEPTTYELCILTVCGLATWRRK
jgi:hypothetical protein